MQISYNSKADYIMALEGAKILVAQKFAVAEAKILAAKAAGDLISDEIYAEFLTWQLLSVLVRNQEVFYNPDDLEEDDE
jgi:hypothetical protein